MRAKKRIALFLAVLLCLMSACGQEQKKENTESKQEKSKIEENSVVETISNTGMGRYVEKSVEVPEITWPAPLTVMQDGTVRFADKDSFRVVSSDETHDTWTAEETALYDHKGDISYISAIGMSNEGDYVIEYIPAEEQPAEENDYEYNPRYTYLKSDGTMTPIDLTLEDAMFLSDIMITSDNRVIGYDYSGVVYEVFPETGEKKELFHVENGTMDNFNMTDKYLIAMGGNTLYFYDLAQNKLMDTPQTLTQFVKEMNINTNGGNLDTKSYMFYSIPGTETLYILNAKGLYSYVMNGNTVEQMIDGSLCSIGNPSCYMNSFVAEPDGTFLVLFSDGKLKRYVYDETVPSVPETCLTVYSLRENQTVKQIISQYQLDNPNVYVRYEQGINRSGDVSYEDAVQNLNKKLLSDEVPDIIVLDELPIDNYNKDGILSDLTPYKEQWSKDGNILTNITEGMATDKGLFVVPVKYQLPAIIAKNEDLSKIKDLKSFADRVEEAGKQDPEGTVMQLRTPEEVLQTLMIIQASNFNNNGTFNREECTELITQAKRVYDTTIKSYTQQDIQDYIDSQKQMEEEGIDNKWVYQASGKGIAVLQGMNRFSAGLVFGFGFDMNIICTIPRSDSNIGYRLGFFEGDTHYIPTCMIGITAKSSQKDAAADFIATALSTTVQDIELQDGFPVNMLSIKKTFAMGENPANVSGGLGSSQEGTDEPFMLDVLYPNPKQAKEMETYLNGLNKPFVTDEVMKNTILEVAPRAVKGEISIDDAVGEIENRMRIRLAE